MNILFLKGQNRILFQDDKKINCSLHNSIKLSIIVDRRAALQTFHESHCMTFLSWELQMSSGPKAGRIMLAVIYLHVVIPWARQFTDSFAYFNPINPCSNLMRQVLLIILTLQRSKERHREATYPESQSQSVTECGFKLGDLHERSHWEEISWLLHYSDPLRVGKQVEDGEQGQKKSSQPTGNPAEGISSHKRSWIGFSMGLYFTKLHPKAGGTY